MAAPKFCTQCHTLAPPRPSARIATFVVWAVLLAIVGSLIPWPLALFGYVPALACLSAAAALPRVCPACASRDLIPPETPRARNMLGDGAS